MDLLDKDFLSDDEIKYENPLKKSYQIKIENADHDQVHTLERNLTNLSSIFPRDTHMSI